MLTQEKLKELVRYNELTGKFYWNYDSKHHNTGEVADRIHSKRGYKRARVCLLGKQYASERLVFLYMTGQWPVNMVDHVNHETSDNRFCNLRDVSNQENQFNQIKPHRGAKTKYLGVSFFARTNRYQARISIDKKQTHLGYFDTPELAWEAYKTAKAKYHGIVL